MGPDGGAVADAIACTSITCLTRFRLWAVMGELVLRAPRDADLGRILRQTDSFWHRTLRDLIARAIAQGDLDPGLDADDTAALLIAAIKGVSLPTVAGFQPEVADQVF